VWVGSLQRRERACAPLVPVDDRGMTVVEAEQHAEDLHVRVVDGGDSTVRCRGLRASVSPGDQPKDALETRLAGLAAAGTRVNRLASRIILMGRSCPFERRGLVNQHFDDARQD